MISVAVTTFLTFRDICLLKHTTLSMTYLVSLFTPGQSLPLLLSSLPKGYASASFLLGNQSAWAHLWTSGYSSSDRNSFSAKSLVIWAFSPQPVHTLGLLWLLSQSWLVYLCLMSQQISPKGVTDLVGLYYLWLSFEGERPEQFLGRYYILKAYKNVKVGKPGWLSALSVCLPLRS